MHKTSNIAYSLVDVSPDTPALWVRTHIFDVAIAQQKKLLLDARLSQKHTERFLDVYASSVNSSIDALTLASTTLRVEPSDAGVTLSYDYRHELDNDNGDEDSSAEDTDLMWLRSGHHDLVVYPLMNALQENSYCLLLNDNPPAPEIAQALRAWYDAFKKAMSSKASLTFEWAPA